MVLTVGTVKVFTFPVGGGVKEEDVAILANCEEVFVIVVPLDVGNDCCVAFESLDEFTWVTIVDVNQVVATFVLIVAGCQILSSIAESE